MRFSGHVVGAYFFCFDSIFMKKKIAHMIRSLIPEKEHTGESIK